MAVVVELRVGSLGGREAKVNQCKRVGKREETTLCFVIASGTASMICNLFLFSLRFQKFTFLLSCFVGQLLENMIEMCLRFRLLRCGSRIKTNCG